MSESTEQAVSDRPKGGGGHAAHDEEHHDANAYPYVQHHYDNPAQQLEAVAERDNPFPAVDYKAFLERQGQAG